MGILDELDRISQPAGGKNAAERDTQRIEAPVIRVKAGPSSRADGSRSKTPDQVSLKELQNQVAQYGFRPGKRRSVLLQQLEDVRRALEEHADQDTSFSSSVFSSSPTALQSSPEKVIASAANAAIEVSSDDGHSSADYSEQDRDHGRVDCGSRCDDGATDLGSDGANEADDGFESEDGSSSHSCGGSDDDGEVEEKRDLHRTSLTKRISAGAAKANEIPLGSVPAAVAKQLFEAVKSDQDVYRRILLYEPISFDEISSLAKRAGVQGLRNKEMLRNWLDVQCICFYTSELTGQRQRY